MAVILDKPTVVPSEEMSEDNFFAHMMNRHGGDLRGIRQTDRMRTLRPEWRTFHDKVHELRPHDYEHQHESPKTLSVLVGRIPPFC